MAKFAIEPAGDMAKRARRLAGLAVLSLLAHAATLGLLALAHPHLRALPVPDAVYDVQVVRPVYLAPRRPPEGMTPPLAARPIKPRQVLRAPEQSDVAPLVTPRAQAPANAPPSAWTLAPPQPGAAASPPGLSRALRRGTAGCAHPDLLSRDERAACLERLGRGARDAPFIPPPIAADKQREWDEAAARKRAKWREREGTVPDPVPSGPSSPSQAPNPFPELWTPRN